MVMLKLKRKGRAYPKTRWIGRKGYVVDFMVERPNGSSCVVCFYDAEGNIKNDPEYQKVNRAYLNKSYYIEYGY